MKNFWTKWTGCNLVLRIVCGLVLGAIFALIIPSAMGSLENSAGAAEYGYSILAFFNWLIEIFGTLFVGALKGLAPILVFLLVSTALASAKVGSGKAMKRVIILYIVGTVAAALLAVVMSKLIPVEMIFPSDTDLSEYEPPEGLGEVITTLLTNVVANPVDSIANGNYLGILFAAILFGIALRKFTTTDITGAMQSFSNAATTVIRWVIEFAPLGIMGLFYSAIADSGLSVLADYGWLLLVLIISMLAMFLIVNPLIVFVNLRQNPYPLVFKCIARSAVTAFFTRSSAANIPVNMELCKDLDLDEDVYSISIPLGSTVNMEGAAITIAVMTLAACNTLGIHVDFITSLLLCILSAVGACGASGVAGGSLLLIPMACSLFGISNDISASVIGVGFIIGVIQDSLETALNSSTDALFTATADIACRKKQKKLEEAKAKKQEKAKEKAQD